LDLAANNGNVDFTFTGTLAGSPVFSITGTEPGQFGPFFFVTEMSGASADLIDALVVTTNIHGTSTNIDNIVVEAMQAPEPMTLGMLAIGLALLGLLRWGGRNRQYLLRKQPDGPFSRVDLWRTHLQFSPPRSLPPILRRGL